MTPAHFLVCAVAPALSLLPAKMASRDARVMLLAMALQESGLRHRRQVKGPARSYLQFEIAGVAGVLAHHTTQAQARALLADMDYPDAGAAEVYAAIEHNDVLAVAFARLLLYTLPQPLASDELEGWRQYQAAWRPGRPHPDRWPSNYRQAVAAVGL